MASACKTSLLILICFSPLLANGQSLDHHLGLDWSSGDDIFEATDRSGDLKTFSIKTQGYLISYGYQASETTQLSLSYSDNSSDQSLDNTLKLERDSDNFSGTFHYDLQEDLGLSASLSQFKQVTRVRGTFNNDRYSERQRINDLSVRLTKDFFLDSWMISPSLFTVYQENDVSLWQNFLLKRELNNQLVVVDQHYREKSKGLLFGGSIDFTHLYSINVKTDLLTSISLSWSEPVSGDISQSQQYGVGSRVSAPATSSSDYSDHDGSGSISFQSTLLLERFDLGIVATRYFMAGETLDAWSASIGYDF